MATYVDRAIYLTTSGTNALAHSGDTVQISSTLTVTGSFSLTPLANSSYLYTNSSGTVVGYPIPSAADDGYVLTWSHSDGYFIPLPSAVSGITQLIGDGYAGPGSGVQTLTLATVNGDTGTWGSTSQIPQITVNAKGLITAVATYDLTVTEVSGVTISGVPTAGQVLTAYSSTDAYWQTPSGGGGSFSAGGDLSGTSTDQTVIAIQGNRVLSQTLSSVDDGYVLVWDGLDGYWRAEEFLGNGGNGLDNTADLIYSYPPLANSFTIVGGLGLEQQGNFILARNTSGNTGNQALLPLPSNVSAEGPWVLTLTASVGFQYNTYYPAFGLIIANGTTQSTSLELFNGLYQDTSAQNSLGVWTAELNTQTRPQLLTYGPASLDYPSSQIYLRILCDGTNYLTQWSTTGGYDWRTSYIMTESVPAMGPITNYGFDLGTYTSTAYGAVVITGLSMEPITTQVNISDAYNSGGSTAYFTTATPHNLVTGASITIVSLETSSGDFNTLYENQITVTGPYTFTFPSGTTFVYVSGGIITDVGRNYYGVVGTGFGGFIASGDLSGSSADQTVTGLQGNPVQSGTLTSAQDGYVLTWDSDGYWTALPAGSSPITLSGDVTGSSSSTILNSIDGYTLPNPGAYTGLLQSAGGTLTWGAVNLGSSLYVTGVLPTANQAAQAITGITGDASFTGTTASGTITLDTVNSNIGTFGSATQSAQVTVNEKGLVTAVSNVTITGVTPGGSAGGDLSGTYPNPTIGKLDGYTLPSPTSGVLEEVGGSLVWSTVNLASSTYVSGVLPTANQAYQNLTLTGDVTSSGGTTNSASTTVVAINGTSVPASPTANYVLSATSGTAATWGLIVNSNVSATAAIAGTKISPNFGSQAVSTTGSVTSNSLASNSLDTASAGTLSIGVTNASAMVLGNSSMTVSILGNLAVAGTTTTISSNTVDVTDRVINLNYSSAYNAPGPTQISGFEVQLGNDGYVPNNAPGVFWNPANSSFEFAYNNNGDGYTLGSDVPIKASALTLSGFGSGYVVTTTTGGLLQATSTLSSSQVPNLSGDVTGNVSSNLLTSIDGYILPNPGNNIGVLQSSGSALTWAAVNLASSSYVTGVLPTANQANQSLTLTGDVTSSGGTTGSASTILAKIDGYTLPTPAAPAIGVLQTSGTALTWGTVNLASSSYVSGTLPAANQASQTMGGDISGTTASATVVSISGASPIAITPATLQWLSTTAAPTIKQATVASGTGANLTLQAQTTSSGTGGNLVLAPGSGSTASGVIVLQSAGSQIGTIQSEVGGSGYNSLYLNGTTAASAANAVLSCTNNITVLNAGATMYLQIGRATTYLELTSGAIQQAVPTNFISTMTNPVVSQLIRASDAATQTFTLQAQNAFASASTNITGGTLVLSSGAGTSTPQTNNGYVQLASGGTTMWQAGYLNGTTATAGLYALSAGPSATNYVLESNGSVATINSPGNSNLQFALGGLVKGFFTSNGNTSLTLNCGLIFNSNTSTNQTISCTNQTQDTLAPAVFNILGNSAYSIATTHITGGGILIQAGNGATSNPSSAGIGGNTTITSGDGYNTTGLLNGTSNAPGILALQAAGITALQLDGYGLHLGATSITLTMGTTSLTIAQSIRSYISFTGTLTGACTVNFPYSTTAGQIWYVDTTAIIFGSYSITFSIDGYTTYTSSITSNSVYQLVYNGTQFYITQIAIGAGLTTTLTGDVTGTTTASVVSSITGPSGGVLPVGTSANPLTETTCTITDAYTVNTLFNALQTSSNSATTIHTIAVASNTTIFVNASVLGVDGLNDGYVCSATLSFTAIRQTNLSSGTLTLVPAVPAPNYITNLSGSSMSVSASVSSNNIIIQVTGLSSKICRWQSACQIQVVG